MSNDMFKREPVTLDGYVPAFTKEETCLHFEHDHYKIGGGPLYFSDPDEPEKFGDRYTITILDKKFTGKKDWYGGDMFEIAAEIANEILADEKNRVAETEAWTFLTVNAKSLNASKRYWKAVAHRQRIDEQIMMRDRLTRKINRAEVLASLYALEVKEGPFTKEERAVKLAEFNGGEWRDEDE